MKVKHLIEKLLKTDPEAEVIITSSNFELNGADVPLGGLIESDKGSKKERTFRDAFDGEIYSKEIWSISGGSLSVIHFY